MKFARVSYMALVFLFLYTPIAILVIFSFNESPHSLLWHGFTFEWYRQLFQDVDLGVVTLHSFEIGLLSSTFATFLGLLGAVILYRYQFFGKKVLNMSILMLIIMPDLVLGIALLLLYSFMNFPLGFWSLLLAHITFSVPFACVTISSRLSSFDRKLIEAGQDLGANERVLYQRILLPLLLPGIVAAWLLCFTLSFDDVIISYFVSGPSFEILPLRIFALVKVGVSPEINALCTIILLLTFAAAIGMSALMRRPK